MTDVVERKTGAGRVMMRVLLAGVLLSPVGVGVMLAPKAGDMAANPELAPPPPAALPDAVRGILSSRDQEAPPAQRASTTTPG